MNQVSDLTAKLLATENITVIRSAVKTASFNVETRQLTLPIWKDMTSDLEGMLIGHEVGHALWSTDDLFVPVKENSKLRSYINVVEDVRIERLMKIKYPGIRKIFTTGYTELNNRGFFGTDKIADMSSLNLIDRMNLWFKVGLKSNVKFTNTEKQFIIRAEKTETVQDVIDLAKAIYDYSKEELEKNPPTERIEIDFDDMEFEPTDSDMNDADSEMDDEIELETDFESNGSESQPQKTQEELIDDALQSITESSLSGAIDELSDTSIVYKYHSLSTNYADDFIVDYKTVLKETSCVDDYQYMLGAFGFQTVQLVSDAFNQFKTNNNRTISYLIKEFEMKKAATNYNKSKIAKSGSLNMSKIYAYQLNDDLFKRINIVHNGKNHGMVFLLDWSGSMRDVIHDTIEQVITLSSFCHRLQIPFQVLAFTSSYYPVIQDEDYYIKRKCRIEKDRMTKNLIRNAIDCCNLVEFFNHKMTASEFNIMSKRLYNTFAFIGGAYKLGGTPLNESLAFMTDYLNTFIRNNNVENVSFITLTDGQGHPINSTSGLTEYAYPPGCYGISGIKDRKDVKHFITDPITKITYPFSADPMVQTATLLKMIKSRYNINNIGFYVTGSASDKALLEIMYYNNVGGDNVDVYKKQIKQQDFAIMPSVGRDELIVIPSKSLKITDGELQVTSKQSAKTAAKSLTKLMTGRQINRLLLNRFIHLIA